MARMSPYGKGEDGQLTAENRKNATDETFGVTGSKGRGNGRGSGSARRFPIERPIKTSRPRYPASVDTECSAINGAPVGKDGELYAQTNHPAQLTLDLIANRLEKPQVGLPLTGLDATSTGPVPFGGRFSASTPNRRATS